MAVRISLTQGQVALVDDDDSDLARLKWHAARKADAYYARRHATPDRRLVYMHRVILERKLGRSIPDTIETDHVNHNGLDNRRRNLRELSHADNIRNHAGFSNNTSGKTGVSWDRNSGKWRAYIKVRYRRTNIGFFASLTDAIAARERAERGTAKVRVN